MERRWDTCTVVPVYPSRGAQSQTCCEKQHDSSTWHGRCFVPEFEPVPSTGTHAIKGMGLSSGPRLNRNTKLTICLSWHLATQTVPGTLLSPFPARAPRFGATLCLLL